MTKCPFCHYDNEEGALFCEQCKSDLAGVDIVPAIPVEAAIPIASAEIVETAPLMAIPEGTPLAEAIVGESAVAEAIPILEGLPAPETTPFEAVSAMPLASEVIATSIIEAPAVAGPSSPTQAPAQAPTVPAGAPVGAAPAPLPADAQPRLVVQRGLKRNVEYPIYEGPNFIGRADEKPVDIDLDDQEAPDRVWSSRQHAVITFEDGRLLIEDLNSSNGTFVNRAKIYPGQKKELAVNDIVQVGTVQMKVIV